MIPARLRSRTPVRASVRRTATRTALAAARASVLCAAALGLLPSGAHALAGGAAPDTVPLVNVASVSFRDASGIASSASAGATVLLDKTAGVELAPPRAATARPGERLALAHRLRNTGNGLDRFALAAAAPAGWGAAVFRDVDGDGRLGSADSALAAPLPLEAGASADLLLVLDVPADSAAASVEASLAATSSFDPSVSASVRDRIDVVPPRAAPSLEKTVDRALATRGDTLRYALAFRNGGDGTAAGVELRDPLPAGARLVAGSLRLDGAPLTDAADGDAAEVERAPDGRETVVLRPGDLAPGAAGTLAFAATVAADAAEGDTLVNAAVLRYAGGADVPAAAATRIALPRLEVTKERLGADTVFAGDLVEFRIGWSNLSGEVAVREAVLVDTLPDGLAFVSAEGSPEVAGRVVTWRLGTLEPGASGSFLLATRAVAADDLGERSAVNRVFARGANAEATSAEALPLSVRAFRGDELRIDKRAGVLEAALGEVVPYAVTVRNAGGLPLDGVVVRDRLPSGVRLLADRVEGADSLRLDGRDLTLFLPGPLAPGAEHRVRYAVSVVSGGDRTLENRAVAEAAPGLRSDTAVARVRLRGGFALRSRVLIGKVWVDRDGDGAQGPGEEGVPGAEVWSADGEVVVTDAEGRFSLRDLRTGSHVLRLDTLSLPAGVRLERAEDETVPVRMDGWTSPRVSFRVVPRAAAPAPSSVPVASTATVLGGGDAASPGAASTDSPSTAVAALSAESAPAGTLRPEDEAGAVEAPTVAPLRTEEERAEDARRSFVAGPAVRIFAPADGSVVSTNRVHVGVRGEPGADVRIFDGDSLIARGTLRPDGVMDFVGVELSEGPHRLRVAMNGSWRTERWDSVAVHRSGAPARIEAPAGPLELRADSRRPETVRVRLVDEWGVPVGGGTAATVRLRGARLDAADADASSVGTQLRADAAGRIDVPLRGGSEVGEGSLALEAGAASLSLPLRILPSDRAVMATGAAQVAVGAGAPESYGAVTVRGAVGEETTVILSYDSRRGGDGDDFFGGGYDPLDEARYPTVGDGSERRETPAATQKLTARVERGLDWVEAGDVSTEAFGGDARLGAPVRSLAGVSGRVATGPVVWRAFGSLTDQALVTRQLRADGTSGPYRFGAGLRPGTDRLALEVRDRDNAARVVSRQALSRFVDYQIDYLSGEVLLNRPVPSVDPAGNPVFVVMTVERRSGGERRLVGGVRVEADAAPLLPSLGADSLGVSLFGVRDGAEGALGESPDLLGGALRLRRGGLEVGGELLGAVREDSTALAGLASARWRLPWREGRLEAEWMRVGDGFGAATDPRLAAGLEELRLGASVELAGARLGLRHERQSFRAYDVERAATTLRAEREVAGRRLTAEAGFSEEMAEGASDVASYAVGRSTLAVTPEMDVWLEGTRALSRPDGVPTRPDAVGAGVGYRLWPGMRLEGSHRRVRLDPDSATYGITSVGLRTDDVLGGELWGSLERIDARGASHAATLGWKPRLALEGGWALHAMVERRVGVDGAALSDPVRALPFPQADRDRWAFGAGIDWISTDEREPRLSVQGEMHDGDLRHGYRWQASADALVGRSLALLTRHDWSEEVRDLGARTEELRHDRSLLGLALRPASSDAFNALAKVEWRRTRDPLLGGVLAGAGAETRLIGAADAIWAPAPEWELAARWAVRHTEAQDTALFGAEPLTSLAHYVGARAQRDLGAAWRVRLDGRFLAERASGAGLWSLAPSLARGLGGGLEVEGGWRFGDLEDPDFASFGGNGPFVVLGLRFTEGTVGSVADFWRERVARE